MLETSQLSNSINSEIYEDDFAHCPDDGNPHRFLCGDTPVNIRFNPRGKSLSESLIGYFSSLKSTV
jgi:hypothetical protein